MTTTISLELQHAVKELRSAEREVKRVQYVSLYARLSEVLNDMALALDDIANETVVDYLERSIRDAGHELADVAGRLNTLAQTWSPRRVAGGDAIYQALRSTREELEDAIRRVDAGGRDILVHLGNASDLISAILTDLEYDRRQLGRLDRVGHALIQLGARRSMRRNPSGAELDEHAAEELLLYLQNDARFWGPRSQGEAIEKRYATLWKKGKFDEERAADGYMHVLKSAAQQYVKEMGSPSDRWYEMFNVPTRRAAAKELVEQFVAEANLGNFR